MQAITKAVGRCDVLLAVIGPQWLSVQDANETRRLDAPGDLVHLEIKTALERGICVIPVVVQGAGIPDARELPPDLASLPHRNGIFLRADDWRYGVNRIVETIESVALAGTGTSSPETAVVPAAGWQPDGWATKGSRLQCQMYVNLPDRREELTAKVLDALPTLAARSPSLTWVTPLREFGFYEPRDLAMLQTLGLDELRGELARFWPAGGPRWDALAVCDLDGGRSGALLAEGKSYPGEMYSAGTQAGKSGSDRGLESRCRIEDAVGWAQQRLGISPDPGHWLDPLIPGRASSSLYQTANRLTYALWLNEQGIDTWFCHLLFKNDPTHQPTTESQWAHALHEAEHALGIDDIEIPFAGHAFLQGLDPRLELASS